MMLLGISIPRNKTLADILMRLSAMERYGIGIPTIFASYENFSVKPTLVCAHEYIKLDLPRLQQIPSDLTERESDRFLFETKRCLFKKAATGLR